MSILSYDLETSINSAEHGPDAKDPVNDFYTVIYGDNVNNITVIHDAGGFKRDMPEDFINKLKTTKIIVGHNLGFDLAYISHHKWFQQWILDGGEVWCTQVARYLLTGQRHKFSSLGELQKIYLGQKEKEDRISALYRKGIGGDKIVAARKRCPRLFKLYEKYCYDDGRTPLQIFPIQVEQAQEKNMLQVIRMYNEYMLALVWVSMSGIKVDKDYTQKTLREFSLKSLEIQEEMQQYLDKYWNNPKLPDFKPKSTDHKSALIFGGPVKCTYKVDDGWTKTPTHFEAIKEGKTTCYDKITDLKNGYPEHKKQITEGFKKANKIIAGEFTFKKVFKRKFKNVTEMVHIDGFKCPEELRKETKKENVYKTGKDFVDQLNKNYPDLEITKYVALQQDYALYEKMTSTYLSTFLTKSINGHLYPKFNNTQTKTSRLSSSNPNMQNAPSKGDMGKVIAKCFTAPEGWTAVQIDYSQLEIYCLGWESEDDKLLQDLANGICFHCLRLSWAPNLSEGKSYDEIYDLAKIQEVPEWVSKRSKAKTISYRKAYGGSAKSLAKATDLPEKEVEQLLGKEDAIYSGVKTHNDYIYQTVENNTYYCQADDLPKAMKGDGKNSRRFTPEGVELLPCRTSGMPKDDKTYFDDVYRMWGYYQSITGKMYAFEQEGFIDKSGRLHISFSPTQTKNYQIQGMAADAQASTTAELLKYLIKHQDSVKMINEIHDSKWFYIRIDKLDLHIKNIQSIMESVPEIFKRRFNVDLPLRVPVDVETGPNFAQLSKYKR